MFHYNRAIRALVADKPPVDIVLSACVIFWALENFHGSGQAAFDHMKAAIKILGEWKTRRRPNDPANDLISKYIEPTIIDGIKFASKSRVEELADQMEVLSLTTRDRRIMDMNYPEFDNLADAEIYLGDCISKILALKSQTQIQTSSDLAQARLIEEIGQLDAELFKWMHLFQNLTATGPVHARRMLIVHNVAANILLEQLKIQAGYQVEQETEPSRGRGRDSPERISRCRHHFIMMEVEDMVSHNQLNRGDACSLGFIAPIFLVATGAHPLEYRQKAIQALETLDVIEGPWYSEHAAKIATAILETSSDTVATAVPVQWQEIHFSYDAENETLSMNWLSEAGVSQRSTVSKTIEVPGMVWDGSVSCCFWLFPPRPRVAS